MPGLFLRAKVAVRATGRVFGEFLRCPSSRSTGGAAPPRYTASGPRPEIGAGPSLVPRCAIPHRAEAADTQRSSIGAKARGHVAKGHVARTAKVPINCYVNSLIIPDKVGTTQRLRRPTRDEDLPSLVVGAAHGLVELDAVRRWSLIAAVLVHCIAAPNAFSMLC